MRSATDARAGVRPRSAALVSGPTIPSTVSPWLAWNFCTAASVSGPKMPSTGMPRACCSSCTCRPSSPSLSSMMCSVVVGGSAAVGAVELASARLAAGPALSATSAPSESRLARVPAGTKRSSRARLRARERPRDSSHGSAAARSRTLMARLRSTPSSVLSDGGTVRPRRHGAYRPAARGARENGRRRPPRGRVRQDRATDRSACVTSFRLRVVAPTGLAVGLAHMRYATLWWRFAPAALCGRNWVPRSPTP